MISVQFNVIRKTIMCGFVCVCTLDIAFASSFVRTNDIRPTVPVVVLTRANVPAQINLNSFYRPHNSVQSIVAGIQLPLESTWQVLSGKSISIQNPPCEAGSRKWYAPDCPVEFVSGSNTVVVHRPLSKLQWHHDNGRTIRLYLELENWPPAFGEKVNLVSAFREYCSLRCSYSRPATLMIKSYEANRNLLIVTVDGSDEYLAPTNLTRRQESQSVAN